MAYPEYHIWVKKIRFVLEIKHDHGRHGHIAAHPFYIPDGFDWFFPMVHFDENSPSANRKNRFQLEPTNIGIALIWLGDAVCILFHLLLDKKGLCLLAWHLPHKGFLGWDSIDWEPRRAPESFILPHQTRINACVGSFLVRLVFIYIGPSVFLEIWDIWLKGSLKILFCSWSYWPFWES